MLPTPIEKIAQDIIAINLSQKNKSCIQETHMYTVEKIEFAISWIRNCSIREDEFLPGVIKKAWPSYKKIITSFFDICLNIRHHP